MANHALICTTVRRAEAAQRNAAKWGREVLELQDALYRITIAHDAAPIGSNRRIALLASRLTINVFLSRAEKNRRAAYARWTNAQATLAANPLPGDA